jgi:threonylcarbamoyladenosine tRNA methylthiotransferase MtaB
MKIAIFTIGCKVNQYESDSLATLFKKKGHGMVDKIEAANICIVNTCTVTHRADYDSRRVLRQIIKKNPQAICIATGCYVQIDYQKLAQIEGIDYLIGNREKAQLIKLLPYLKKQSIPQIWVGKNPTSLDTLFCFPPPDINTTKRTRAYLKIQDGCDTFCSYCIIPYARGRTGSLLPEEIIKRIHYLQNQGFKEIVLTGIHLGEYGKDFSPILSFSELLKLIKKEKFATRFRLSSLNPSEITDDLIKLFESWPNLCPHLHIVLQSGSDTILQKMGRVTYTKDIFEKIVLDLKQRLLHFAIGVDIIVGFPGEMEKDFVQTYNLIKRLPISYCHIFSYSERPGTKSVEMKGKVPLEIIKKRVNILKELDKDKRKQFFKKNLGRIVQVLVEQKVDGFSKGHSENYIYVYIKEKNQINQIVPVKLIDYSHDSVYGKRI